VQAEDRKALIANSAHAGPINSRKVVTWPGNTRFGKQPLLTVIARPCALKMTFLKFSEKIL